MADYDPRPLLRARVLRYFVCLTVLQAKQRMTMPELIAALEQSGCRVSGRPSKAISDSLRWAVPRGWITPAGRGAYAPGRIAKSTQWYMRQALAAAQLPGGDPVTMHTLERRLTSRLLLTQFRARTGDLGERKLGLSL